MRIDLNADLGEGMGDDAAMLDVVSSANVACGGHAGDETSMRQVCSAAVARGVTIGAHVSYPDVAGFGRTEIDMPADALLASLRSQMASLTRAAAAERGEVRYVKPHGALYHRVAREATHAEAVVTVAGEAGLAVVGLPGSLVLRLAADAGLSTITEAFADRAYRRDGGLVPRTQPGAVLHDPAEVAQRMVGLVRDGVVPAVDGSAVLVSAASICVHSDTPGAVAIATTVRAALVGAGVEIAAAA